MELGAREDVFRHEAFLHAGELDFLRGALEFVEGALVAGEPLLAIVSAAKIDALRAALGRDARRVEFDEVEVVGRNPARFIPAWRAFVGRCPPGTKRMRGIAEPIWPARLGDELIESQHHESLLNLAFAQTVGLWLLCSYDTDTLEADVIDDARRSHAFVADGAGHHPSVAYLGTGGVEAPFDGPLAEPAVEPVQLFFDDGLLHPVRALVSEQAAANGLARDRAADLVLAVDEVASNSVRHGRERRRLRVWNDAETLICEVRDYGRIVDPLVGKTRPASGQEGGRGLWIANQVCDLVQLRSSAAGTVVRLHMRNAV